MESIERISSLLTKTFEKTPWYGPSVTMSLENLTQEEALQKLPGSHSVIELVNHMIAWRTFVTERLLGNDDFSVGEHENFPTSNDWPATMQSLRTSQEKLLAALKITPEDKLGQLVPHPTYKYTFYTMLHGIIQHDIYHIGQINLIRKVIS